MIKRFCMAVALSAITILPVTTLAATIQYPGSGTYTTLQKAFNAAASGDTIELTAAVTESAKFTGKSITFDLAGNTISGTSPLFQLGSGAELIITDSTGANPAVTATGGTVVTIAGVASGVTVENGTFSGTLVGFAPAAVEEALDYNDDTDIEAEIFIDNGVFSLGSGVALVDASTGAYQGQTPTGISTVITGGTFSSDPSAYNAIPTDAVNGYYAVTQVPGGYQVLPAVATDGTSYYVNLTDAVAGTAANGTITLIDNDTVSFANGGVAINKNLTIDGAGYTITGVSDAGSGNVGSPSEINDSTVHGFYIKGGDVTIKNVTLTQFGDTDYVNKFGYTPVLTSTSYTGKLTLQNVNIDKFNRQAICAFGGTLTVTGGTITANAENKGTGFDQFQQPIEVRGSTTATIDGVTITGGGSNVGYSGGAIVAFPGSTATVNNANINYTGIGIWSDTATVTVTGSDTTITATDKAVFVEEAGTANIVDGTYNGAFGVDSDPNNKIAISGGRFNTAVDANYFDESHMLGAQDGGYYTVDTAVASVTAGDPATVTKYTDLATAIAAAGSNGGTVKLLADYTGEAIAISGPMSIDYNGYTANITAAAKIGNTVYPALSEAIAAVGAGDVTIELLNDVTWSYPARSAYGTDETTKLTINGNGHTLTLHQTDTDWSSLGLKNENAVLAFENVTINKTSAGGNGAWNNHAIIVTSKLSMTDVTVNNSLAVENDATLTNVTITEAGEYYGLWITGEGQTVTFNGGSITATNKGRGIKIADEYVKANDRESVTLNISNVDFNTAKKAAVLVTSTAGAAITATDVDISDVATDSTNIVWVDEARSTYFGEVTLNGGAAYPEGGPSAYAATLTSNGVIEGYYKTIDAVIAAYEDGDTITLINYVAGTTVIPEDWGVKTEDGVTTLYLLPMIAKVTKGETVTEYNSLQKALDAAATAGADVTVDILDDIDLTGTTWNSVYLNGYDGSAKNIVVNGNNKTITGLTAPLIQKIWSSASIKFKDLTVSTSTIGAVTAVDTCSAAFIGGIDSGSGAEFTNCHVVNCTIGTATYCGAFIGYTSDRNAIAITNCSVENCTITGTGSSGSLIGHTTSTKVTITDTTATDNTITGANAAKTGILIGTDQGTTSLSATESGNTLYGGETQLTGNDVHEIGRVVGGTVIVTEGGLYSVNPTETSTGTISIPEDFEVTTISDGGYTVTAMPVVAKIGEDGYTTLQKALDAAHEMTGDVTITLIENCTGYAIVYQKAGLNLTIDGDGKTLAGQIIIDGDNRSTGTETLTIKDVVFEDDKTHFHSGTDAFVLVPSLKTSGTAYYNNKNNYAHNITIDGCTFTSTSTSAEKDVVGFKSSSGGGTAYNVAIRNTTGSNLHSLAQFNPVEGSAVYNCSITDSESFVNVSNGKGSCSIEKCTFASTLGGYAVRENGTSTTTVTLTDNDFSSTGNVLVIGKGTSATEGTIVVESGKYAGALSLTDAALEAGANFSISGGLFTVPVKEEYCAEGYIPTTTTVDEVTYYTVKLGSYVAQIGDVKYESLAEAITAAGATDAIILLADNTEEIEVSKAVTITKNGFTATGLTPSSAYAVTETSDGYTFATAVARVSVEGSDPVRYSSLQAAIDAAHDMTGEVTVTLITDVTEYVVVHQKAGLNLTIDGQNKARTITGQIFIDGDGRSTGTETLTISGINFTGTTADFYTGTDAFIMVPSTKTSGTPYYTGKYNYAHNVTVTNCTFTGAEGTTDVIAFKSNSAAGLYNLVLDGVTVENAHSLAQLTGTTGATITGCTVTDCESGVNVSGGGGAYTFSGNTISASTEDGYGIRLKDSTTAVATLSDNTITAKNALALGKAAEASNKGQFVIESGLYNGTLAKITTSADAGYAISGGLFTEPVLQEYCAEGYIPATTTVDEVEYYTVAPCKAVTFVNADGTTVLYTANVAVGDTPVYAGDTPTMTSETAVYAFIGWTPALSPVTDAPQTYTAQYVSITPAPLELYLNDKEDITVTGAPEGSTFKWKFAGAAGSGGWDNATGTGHPYGNKIGTGTATLTITNNNEQLAVLVCDITVKDVVARVDGVEYSSAQLADAIDAAISGDKLFEVYQSSVRVALTEGQTIRWKAADNRGKGSVIVSVPDTTATTMYGQTKTTDPETGVTTVVCTNEGGPNVEITAADGVTKTYSATIKFSAGGTTKLLRSFSNGRVTVTVTDAVLDLNGQTVTFDTGTTYPAILIGTTAKKGSLTITDTSETGNGKIVNTGDIALWSAYRSSELIIEGGEFVGALEAVYTSNGSTAVINGGTFKVSGNDSSFLLNCKDDNKGTITVNFGTFYGFNPDNNTADGANTDYVTDAGKMVVEDPTNVWTVYDAVAGIGEDTYPSVQAALDAAEEGDVVTLLRNVTEYPLYAVTACILDLNGFTLTGVILPDFDFAVVDTYVDPDTEATNLGTILLPTLAAGETVEDDSSLDGAIWAWDGSTITIAGGTYTDAPVVLWTEGANVIIDGGVFNGYAVVPDAETCAAATRKNRWDVDAVITVTGGEFNGSYIIGTHQYAKGATLNIEGGWFKAADAWSQQTIDNEGVSVSGGYFAQEPVYLAEGYVAAANTDEDTNDVYPFTVDAVLRTATITSIVVHDLTQSANITVALNNWKSGTLVKLWAKVDYNDAYWAQVDEKTAYINEEVNEVTFFNVPVSYNTVYTATGEDTISGAFDRGANVVGTLPIELSAPGSSTTGSRTYIGVPYTSWDSEADTITLGELFQVDTLKVGDKINTLTASGAVVDAYVWDGSIWTTEDDTETDIGDTQFSPGTALLFVRGTALSDGTYGAIRINGEVKGTLPAVWEEDISTLARGVNMIANTNPTAVDVSVITPINANDRIMYTDETGYTYTLSWNSENGWYYSVTKVVNWERVTTTTYGLTIPAGSAFRYMRMR